MPTTGLEPRVEAPVERCAAARVAPAVVLLAAAAVVANRWGQSLLDDGVRLRILAPPLIGRFRFGPPAGLAPLLVPVLTGAGLARWLPRMASEAGWRRALGLAGLAAAAWAVALALVDGPDGITRPMELTGHYLLDVGQVGSPHDFLRGFTDRIDAYGTHVRSHPPGLVLLLWCLAQVGLSGSGAAAALVIAGGAAAVPAVLVLTRELAGEDLARRALPFVVLAPAALYVASTGDALFAGVGAWAAAGVVVATGRTGHRGDAVAALGGAAFGVGLLLSYGLSLLVLLPVGAAIARRRARPLLVAATAGTAVIGAAALSGFWWVDGLLTTRGEYLESVASVRPYGYFLFANLVGLAIVVGPATLAGLARLLSEQGPARQLALVVGPAAAMVSLADLSGMSKGEVERIWLPFAVLLLPAGALVAEARDAGSVRRWLWVQVGTAVAVTTFVRTHW